MTTISVTVCEMPDDPIEFDAAWDALLTGQRRRPSDLVVLNEAPFDSWFATTRTVDRVRWSHAVNRHTDGIAGLHGLGTHVIGTAPVEIQRRPYNRAFSWVPGSGLHWWRRKTWLPDEPPVFEATWYHAAHDPPDVRTIAGARVAVLICTELWAMDWAGDLGRRGTQVLVTPRATGDDSVDKWLAAGRVAATVSGAFSLSSNRAGNGFGGAGWVIGPDGDVLARTTPDEPIARVDIDLDQADAAKLTYPRYALWTQRWDRPDP